MTQLADSQPAKKSSRILELDAIRALSCLNLLLFHFTYVYQDKYGFASDLGFTFPYGKYGVQLFFMLSGLVNALTLLKKRKPGSFIVARFIRILPSYWLVIALNLILFSTLSMYHETVELTATVANLSTMPNLFGFENMEPVTWTLQVEMLFYAFLMVLLATGLLDRPMRTLMVAISVCLIACLTFDWFAVAFPDSVWNGRFRIAEELFFMRNMPLFAMGILLNELRCKRGTPWVLWLGMLASAVVFHTIDLRDHNPAATVLMFGMLVAGAYGKIPFLRWRPLIYISFISYSLYLFHNNLGSALMKLLESWGVPPLATVIAATAFAIAISAAITHWFEQPTTKYLRGQWIRLSEKWAARSANREIKGVQKAN
ncbi:MAG: acyltransferase [Mariniblastus sp.]|nr:acyltransferase [Mariniblastus sp.]